MFCSSGTLVPPLVMATTLASGGRELRKVCRELEIPASEAGAGVEE